MNKKHTRRSAIKLGGAAALGIAAFPSILSAQTGSLSDFAETEGGTPLFGFFVGFLFERAFFNRSANSALCSSVNGALFFLCFLTGFTSVFLLAILCLLSIKYSVSNHVLKTSPNSIKFRFT